MVHVFVVSAISPWPSCWTCALLGQDTWTGTWTWAWAWQLSCDWCPVLAAVIPVLSPEWPENQSMAQIRHNEPCTASSKAPPGAVTVTGNTHSATIVSPWKISAHRITMLDLELGQKRSIKVACLLLHSQEISENEANLSNNPWPWGDLLSALRALH